MLKQAHFESRTFLFENNKTLCKGKSSSIPEETKQIVRNEKSYDGLGGGRTKRERPTGMTGRTTLSSIPANEGRPALLVCSSENHEISPSASTPTRHVYPSPGSFFTTKSLNNQCGRGERYYVDGTTAIEILFLWDKEKVHTTVEKTRHMRALHRP